MGREIRMVPKGWEHPKDRKGNYIPLRKWYGSRPIEAEYMPQFPEGSATMLMMYEDTSEGTPISPAFETPEKLARWLTNTGASAFGGMTATYDQWLATCKDGWAPSMVLNGDKMMSGVEFSETQKD